ncbi:TetR/AcrR family transcriptional regulator [Paracoccus luteus]|uniref:TetR/AcrR family transcriptional regulator n=1 Tax=Paracoccus luteus TaxID=2508543 RepID=UPI00106FB261|nr:TetR/AcrR family transcriptional regulator [Paracoccus luteus]
MARTTGSRADITGPLVRQAARGLFARHGYAAVTMRQIAAAVGVQAGTLYAYTPDKQGLLAGLLIEHMDLLLAAWDDRPGDPPLVRLERFARFHIAYSLDHPDEVFLSYMELRSLTPENHAAVTALRRRYEDALTAILRDGARAGVMRVADARLTAMALIAMLTGVTNWFRQGGRLDRTAVADHYWGLVRGAVGAG